MALVKIHTSSATLQGFSGNFKSTMEREIQRMSINSVDNDLELGQSNFTKLILKPQ